MHQRLKNPQLSFRQPTESRQTLQQTQRPSFLHESVVPESDDEDGYSDLPSLKNIPPAKLRNAIIASCSTLSMIVFPP